MYDSAKEPRSLINEEVIAFNHINYVKIEQPLGLPGACYWTSVYCLDVGGMVTDAFT